MNEEAKDLLVKYLQVGAEKLEAGMGFVESEIPLVVQEYLSWFWAYSLMCVIGSVIMAIIASILWCLFFKFVKKADGSNSESFFAFVTGLPSVMLTITSVIFFCENCVDLVKVSVAPRIVVLEKLSELTR